MLAPGLFVQFGSAAMKPRLPAVPVVAWVVLIAMLASWLLTWSPTAAARPSSSKRC